MACICVFHRRGWRFLITVERTWWWAWIIYVFAISFWHTYCISRNL